VVAWGWRSPLPCRHGDDQWDNGSNLRLGRVPKGDIPRREAWEWVCAFDPSGEPAWSHALDAAVPVLSLHRWLGIPEMVYVAGIRRYLLLTWRLHKDFSGDDGTDLIVLDAPEPWGPFSLVHFEEYWEGKAFNPYCPRIPLKLYLPPGGTVRLNPGKLAGARAGYWFDPRTGTRTDPQLPISVGRKGRGRSDGGSSG
jgi:hypothetical protein